MRISLNVFDILILIDFFTAIGFIIIALAIVDLEKKIKSVKKSE